MIPLARRAFLKRSAAVAALLALPAACGEAEDGPGPIRLGRDACDFCRMPIAEIRYSAQIRMAPDNTLYKFDDVGCAVLFLSRTAGAADAGARFWAMNHLDGKTWLDARQAFYLQGLSTPMHYGFAGVPAGTASAVSYDAMTAAVLKTGTETGG